MSELTTFEEDFTVMTDRLIAMGAGECAIAGTIIDDGRMMRAAYFVDTTQQPPVISELIPGPADRPMSMLTRATVIDDEPHMAKSVVRTMEGVALGDQLEFALMDELPNLGTGESRELPFTYMYDYIQGFEPDVQV